MKAKTIFLATKNQGKVREFVSLIHSPEIILKDAASLDPDISWLENGDSFLANARIKAQALRQYTREAVLADDSGLVVEALGGLPGVNSAVYAGENATDRENRVKLLEAMQKVPVSRRHAKFVCCLLYVDDKNLEHIFWGECAGEIAQAERGNKGFGYDPIFLLPSQNRTLAELTLEDKNRISHRARATAQLRAFLGLASLDLA